MELFECLKVRYTNKSSTETWTTELPKELFFDLEPLVHMTFNEQTSKSSTFFSFFLPYVITLISN